MSTPEEAIKILRRCNTATVDYMKSAQRPKGASKSAVLAEDAAFAAAFRALVGRKATKQEVEQITNW